MEGSPGHCNKLNKSKLKKRINSSDKKGGKPLKTDEFAAFCYINGIATAEIDEWNIGFIIDFAHEIYREKLRRSGKKVSSPEESYEKMKKIEPMIDERFKKGEIEQEKYDNFKKLIREYENEI